MFTEGENTPVDTDTIKQGDKMDLLETVKQRKKEQVANNEDVGYVMHVSFDKKYNIRTMAGGLYTVIELGSKYKEDNYIIPKYQRELVWNIENKQNLIQSIMLGSPIGEFIFVKEVIDCHINWTIVDGQQRINALREFVSSKYRDSDGRYYKDYSYREMTYFAELFSNFSAMYIQDLSESEQVEIYLAKNTGGVIHSKEELQKAKDYLAEIGE